VGIAGSLVTAGGWLFDSPQFPHAWLAALTYWIAWPLGSIALVLIHALTGGRWGRAVRRQLAAGIATLPMLLPAAVPLILVTHQLYPWMRPAVAQQLDNRFYLNPPFFYVRSIVYCVVWLGLGRMVLRALRQENPEPRLRRLAPAGLIALALTVTFAAIDYTLSLEPRFQSSIYGWMVGSEAVLLALTVAIMSAARAAQDAAAPDIGDLGRLLFALLVLWAYLDFMQLLIVWNSDLPHESMWYLRRLTGMWAVVAALIAICHFLLPFFALIWPRVQRSRRALGGVAAFLVLVEIPRAWWIVIPAANRHLAWIDAAAMTTVVGFAGATALRALRTGRMTPAAAAHG
jgi:hypothetical protein